MRSLFRKRPPGPQLAEPAFSCAGVARRPWGLGLHGALRGGLAGVLGVVLGGCGEPGAMPPPLPGEVGEVAEAGDAGPGDAVADAASPASVCAAYCAETGARCGVGPTPCADECETTLEGLRGGCPNAFRDFFGCLLASEAFECVGPGVVRPTGCPDELDAWRACGR